MSPFYIVRAGFGTLGQAWVERSPAEATWAETVEALARGEWDHVLQVVEVDLERGTSCDVTTKARLAASLVKEGVPLRVVMARLVISVDSLQIS